MKRIEIVALITLFVISVISCEQPAFKKIDMVKVDGGSFIMGAPDVKWNGPHQVEVDTFLIAKYLITIKDWKLFLKESGLPYQWDWKDQGMTKSFQEIVPTDDCPAQGLNWYYAVAFCNWLSKRDGLEPTYEIQGDVDAFKSSGPLIKGKVVPIVSWKKNANGYRLPTEAEWEYAARGGKSSKGYLYAGSNDSDEVALLNQKQAYSIGKLKSNELGIYDMSGNVAVWCWDWFDAAVANWASIKNPSVDNPGDIHSPDETNPKNMKSIRGFDWESDKPFTVFTRDHYPPQNIGWIGIRLVRNY